MTCQNCQKPLDTTDKYCKVCGAQKIEHRLTLKSVSSELYHGFFSLDTNRPVHTFLDLFSKPKEVIDGYIRGVRKKYVNAFGYFVIGITLSGIFTFIYRTLAFCK